MHCRRAEYQFADKLTGSTACYREIFATRGRDSCATPRADIADSSVTCGSGRSYHASRSVTIDLLARSRYRLKPDPSIANDEPRSAEPRESKPPSPTRRPSETKSRSKSTKKSSKRG